VNHARTLVQSIGITCFGLAWLQASQEIVLGSRVYQPTGDPEARVFERAARDVYPDDVRAEPQRYVKILVAWPGILRSHELKKDDDTATLKLTLEHRYFDWIEDFSPRRERYFLSPRGEGTFRATWSMSRAALDAMPQTLHKGDMLLVYGYPAEVRDRTVSVNPTEYARVIAGSLYTDKALNYGRVKN
jgi:hypothetical protein